MDPIRISTSHPSELKHFFDSRIRKGETWSQLKENLLTETQNLITKLSSHFKKEEIEPFKAFLKFCISCIQESVNHGGIYETTIPRNIRLLDQALIYTLLCTPNPYFCKRNDAITNQLLRFKSHAELICYHENAILRRFSWERKWSFLGTNFTNTANKLNAYIDKLSETPALQNSTETDSSTNINIQANPTSPYFVVTPSSSRRSSISDLMPANNTAPIPLINHSGNDCFINAALQVILNSRCLSHYMNNHPDQNISNNFRNLPNSHSYLVSYVRHKFNLGKKNQGCSNELIQNLFKEIAYIKGIRLGTDNVFFEFYKVLTSKKDMVSFFKELPITKANYSGGKGGYRFRYGEYSFEDDPDVDDYSSVIYLHIGNQDTNIKGKSIKFIDISLIKNDDIHILNVINYFHSVKQPPTNSFNSSLIDNNLELLVKTQVISQEVLNFYLSFSINWMGHIIPKTNTLMKNVFYLYLENNVLKCQFLNLQEETEKKALSSSQSSTPFAKYFRRIIENKTMIDFQKICSERKNELIIELCTYISLSAFYNLFILLKSQKKDLIKKEAFLQTLVFYPEQVKIISTNLYYEKSQFKESSDGFFELTQEKYLAFEEFKKFILECSPECDLFQKEFNIFLKELKNPEFLSALNDFFSRLHQRILKKLEKYYMWYDCSAFFSPHEDAGKKPINISIETLNQLKLKEIQKLGKNIISLILRTGASAYAGHYIALVKKGKKYFKCDDARISPINDFPSGIPRGFQITSVFLEENEE